MKTQYTEIEIRISPAGKSPNQSNPSSRAGYGNGGVSHGVLNSG
jgi:hypothetical protein